MALDASFRIGPVGVRVHPTLVALAVALGLGPHRSAAAVAARALAVLATLFVHELGGALVALARGRPAEIALTPHRLAAGVRLGSLTPRARIAASLAGPALNVAAAAAAFAIGGRLSLAMPDTRGAVAYFAWLNIVWSVVNLLPVVPLDGGYALVAALDHATRGRGEGIARGVSVGVAATLACILALSGAGLGSLLCAYLALHNFHALATLHHNVNREALARAHLTAASDALQRSEPGVAIAHGRTILASSRSPEIRRDAVRLLAYAYATRDDWALLMELLESEVADSLEPEELDRYLRAAGELGRAADVTRLAARRRSLDGARGTAPSWAK
jgi:stage IV sporulation protein FB